MEIETRLLGTWRIDATDAHSVSTFGDASVTFSENGHCTYTIHEAGKDQLIYLTYRVEESHLVTHQPTAPREERTPFFFTSDGRLALIYKCGTVYFRR